jgi:hypothetical protein
MGSFMPVSTIPPLRELAPQPKVFASSTAVCTPRFANILAAESPVTPLPMMATSTLSGKAREGSARGMVAVSSQ